MTQNDRWNLHWQQVMDYIERYRRNPSKHRVEDHRMLNWIKYNKKLIALGKLDKERAERFAQLLAACDKYRRLNQHAYKGTPENSLPIDFGD